MPPIHILPPDLADKIAAGEVVERPASVVKELIENSLDAGATHIRLNILKAGRELIQVIDDGCGMAEEEVTLAIRRHATSKIQNEADLFCIKTLGFRGEALPSVAAVSHLTLETKTKANPLEGTCIEIKGGEVLPARVVGCPVGTQVSVRDLFYNTPARLKFLKSDGVEASHIEDVFCRLSLGKLDCAFDFYADDKQKLSCPVAKDLMQRLKNCLGNSFVEDVIDVSEENPEVQLHGWVVHPRQTTSTANSIYFYLNGRFLKDRVLQHALTSGFEDFLMKGRYPKAVLYLTMDPRAFDVNVHPSKREVRFVRPQAIHEFVAKAVKKALQKKIYANTESTTSESFFVPPLATTVEPIEHRVQKAVERFYGAKSPPSPKSDKNWEVPPATVLSFKDLQVLGAFSQTYILCESPDHQLVLIDQHAAHERIGFEKLKNRLESQNEMSQQLLVPMIWEATPRQSAVLQTHLSCLQKAGLDIEPFGGETFVIKSVPALVKESSIPHLLENITAELDELESTDALRLSTELVLKTVACHGQVRAKDKLSLEEMRHLLIEMDEYRATHCPHGRPTMVQVSLEQIEKWFKRT